MIPEIIKQKIEDEVWKDIEMFEGLFQISNYGRVKNIRTGKIRKLVYSRDGYLTICLYFRRSNKKYNVHRLVSKYFIPNPHNYDCVNHIDLIKENNHYQNLEWCTRKMNMEHAFANRKIKRLGTVTDRHKEAMKSLRKVVFAFNPETKEVLKFDSQKECAGYFGVLSHSISSTIIKKCKIRRKYNLFNEQSWQQFKQQNNL